ncbi:MAG TPA: HAD-IIIC family phosphatase [Acidobacteriaceae bacterium]|nr:HAD-IIIC family phosphatase [Acidobacteriaceae bacterium]
MNIDRLSIDDLLIRRKGLRRRLAAEANLQPVRIFVLGGSTANEVIELLEIFLLAAGFRPEFRQSEYGRYYEDAVQDATEMAAFAPDIVYVHTSCLNVRAQPAAGASAEEAQRCVEVELGRYREIWESIEEQAGAQIIQNNFELPPAAILGNMDSVAAGGATRFFLALNEGFARAAEADRRLVLQDVHRLSAEMGLERWFDWDRYFSYKMLTTSEASIAMARSLASIVGAMYGKSRKVLVLDLDNTLWGGVIGDDGVERIQIGRETPVAEAYTAFQEYCLALYRRGILLAVCSKNDEGMARQGFEHPDSVLKLEHIACFKANWEAKHENILAIAKELKLGVDSLVFVDDNPAERALVEAQLPAVAVPDVGTNVARFAERIERGRYFEPVCLSAEDLGRGAVYQADAARGQMEARFADYGEYLDSLEMRAEIGRFRGVYLERIAQLTNKTNQFNLTTRRYTLAQIEAIAGDDAYIGLYGRLSDRFGDNGLISVMVGRREGRELHIDLWLMSCRVLKREVEVAMLDALAGCASAAGIERLMGYYVPTKKNGMVAEHYGRLGFELVSTDGATGATVWTLDLAGYTARNRHIEVVAPRV